MEAEVCLELFSDILTHIWTKYVEEYHIFIQAQIIPPLTVVAMNIFYVTRNYSTDFLALLFPPLQTLWNPLCEHPDS